MVKLKRASGQIISLLADLTSNSFIFDGNWNEKIPWNE